MKYKTGILIVVLALAILIVVPVHASMARPVPLPDPTQENRQEPLFSFERVSKTVTTDYNKSEFTGIPSSITRYDVIEINESSVRSLHQQILAGNKIPVRFKGTSYLLVMNPNPLDPLPESQELRYIGNLEMIPNTWMQDNNMRRIMTLAFSNGTLTGHISETNGPFTEIVPITNSPSGTRLYYVYSSADERPTGARMDNDVWVMLPSGESKLRNDLSSEELAWYINEQRIRENRSYNNSFVTGSQPAPLPWMVVVVALWVCSGILCWRRKG